MWIKSRARLSLHLNLSEEADLYPTAMTRQVSFRGLLHEWFVGVCGHATPCSQGLVV